MTHNQSVWQQARTCSLCYRMPRNTFFPITCDLLVSQEIMKDTFFFPSLILATERVVAFVLLRNSRFIFHCYAQHEPTPTQKLARKWQLQPFTTSCAKDYKGHSLMYTSFTELPNSNSIASKFSVTYCCQRFSEVMVQIVGKLQPRKPTLLRSHFSGAGIILRIKAHGSTGPLFLV